jgi:hypothetical protein
MLAEKMPSVVAVTRIGTVVPVAWTVARVVTA